MRDGGQACFDSDLRSSVRMRGNCRRVQLPLTCQSVINLFAKIENGPNTFGRVDL